MLQSDTKHFRTGKFATWFLLAVFGSWSFISNSVKLNSQLFGTISTREERNAKNPVISVLSSEQKASIIEPNQIGNSDLSSSQLFLESPSSPPLPSPHSLQSSKQEDHDFEGDLVSAIRNVGAIGVYDPTWPRPAGLTFDQASALGLGVCQTLPSRWEQGVEGRIECGDNSGNLAWAFGAHQLLDTDRHVLIHERARILGKAPPSNSTTRIGALIMGTGPMLATLASEQKIYNPQRMNYIREPVKAVNGPTLIMGMGPLSKIENCDDGLGPRSKAFMEELKDRIEIHGGYVTLRGNCTQRMLTSAGIATDHFPVLGCPTLFLNRRQGMGERLEQKYQKLIEIMENQQTPQPNATSACLRLGIVTNRNIVLPGMIRLLKDFGCAEGNMHLLQEIGDTPLTEKIQKESGKSIQQHKFYDILTWQQAVQQLDLVVGPRIHGSMVPLSMEVPTVTISKDHRIEELCQTMLLAEAPVTETVGDFLASILAAFRSFNGTAFDSNRREKAAQYVQIFRDINLTINPQVAQLAEPER